MEIVWRVDYMVGNIVQDDWCNWWLEEIELTTTTLEVPALARIQRKIRWENPDYADSKVVGVISIREVSRRV